MITYTLTVPVGLAEVVKYNAATKVVAVGGTATGSNVGTYKIKVTPVTPIGTSLTSYTIPFELKATPIKETVLLASITSTVSVVGTAAAAATASRPRPPRPSAPKPAGPKPAGGKTAGGKTSGGGASTIDSSASSSGSSTAADSSAGGGGGAESFDVDTGSSDGSGDFGGSDFGEGGGAEGGDGGGADSSEGGDDSVDSDLQFGLNDFDDFTI